MSEPQDFPCTNTCPIYDSTHTKDCPGHLLVDYCKCLGFLIKIYLEQKGEK